MNPMSVAQRMTADEFLLLGEDPSGRTSQLIAGEIVMNEPLPRHQFVKRDLLVALDTWTGEQPGRGEVMLPLDVRMDDQNVYGPDLLWYAEGRAPRRDGGRPSPIPDIAVEVRSPSTWRRDVMIKKPVYEQYGLPELWLVDTASEGVRVLRRSNAGMTAFDIELTLARGEMLTSPLLPGFELALDDLFSD
jgi:Uma2 family endonuclease